GSTGWRRITATTDWRPTSSWARPRSSRSPTWSIRSTPWPARSTRSTCQGRDEPHRSLAARGAGHRTGPRSPPRAPGSRVTDFLLHVAGEAWSILREASFFLLLGFVLAGVFAVIVPARLLTRFLGRGKIRSVLWASAIGTPLPLCSCGVLPTALGLARQGATRGATVAVLISTPEPGVDSIALSYALAALVAVLLPASVIERYFGGGLVTMLAMLAIGIPIYTCASASTPVAAALVLKGLSPGAALVFLLSGPATNVGAIVVLLKFLGRRVVAIYLLSIAVVSLAAGYTLDWVYRTWQLSPAATFGTASGFVPEPVKVASALLVLALLARSLWRVPVPEEWLRPRDWLARLTGVRLTAPRLRVAAMVAAALIY